MLFERLGLSRGRQRPKIELSKKVKDGGAESENLAAADDGLYEESVKVTRGYSVLDLFVVFFSIHCFNHSVSQFNESNLRGTIMLYILIIFHI